jgi:hypothetical protein
LEGGIPLLSTALKPGSLPCATSQAPRRISFCVQAVYGVLKEAEHRSTCYIPYWNLPLARHLVPRQRKFRADLLVINDCLDTLITQAKATRQEGDIEALQNRDYSRVRLSRRQGRHLVDRQTDRERGWGPRVCNREGA